MQITEARVFNFGKLQKKTYRFSPGINVIYGRNEAGKTTLHAFLLAMLFGMDKNRGRAATGDLYTRYEPWHAPSFYSGAIRFTVGGRPFYLERNFYHREKRELLRNEADGEELSVAYGDLTMLMGGIGKETFGNTYDVPQCGVLDGKELANILTEYLADAAESRDGGTHVARAAEALESKRKTLNSDLRKLQEQKQKEKRALEIEQELLERDCRTLRTEIEREEAELKRAKGKRTDGNRQTLDSAGLWKLRLEKRTLQFCRICRILAAFSLLATLVNLGIFLGYGYAGWMFAVTETILIITFVVFAIAAKKMRGKQPEDRKGTDDLSRNLEGENTTENTAGNTVENTAENTAWMQAERMLESQREQLLEKETRLYNIKEGMTEFLKTGQREKELSEDIQAVELAAAEIKRLAEEYSEEMSDELNAELSRWTSLLTGGVYDDVRVDSDGSLKVMAEDREIAPEALSRGTLEQFYLAFRIAVGSIATREEKMPLFLDETFAMYDDERLSQTLGALAKMEQQVFLFTCQKREMELLERLGVTYHVVNME